MPKSSYNNLGNMYLRSNSPGCIGGMLNMFDWNITSLGGGKKLLADLDFSDGLTGIEAPRNSLDIAPGEIVSGDILKSSLASKFDIPYGSKIGTSIASEDSLSEGEKRRRSRSVVARLMGLDALHDAQSATMSDQEHSENRKNPTNAGCLGPNSVKINDAIQTNSPRRAQLNTGKELEFPEASQLNTGNELEIPETSKSSRRSVAEQVNGKSQFAFDTAVTRKEHPQEKQLQEFKKQFASNFSTQTVYEPELCTRQVDVSNFSIQRLDRPDTYERQVDVEKVMVVGKVDETKAVPIPDIVSDPNKDPRRLAAALKKLNESKEFQDVLEVLQSNKEFFFQFLQDPNALMWDKYLGVPLTEDNSHKPSSLPEVKSKEQKEGPNQEKKKGGLSPTAFARRFMEFRREGKKSKGRLKSQEEPSKPQSEIEKNRTRLGSSLLPRVRGKSKPKSPEMDPDLIVRTADICTETTYLSEKHLSKDPSYPGNIVVLSPDYNDTTIDIPASNLAHLSRASSNSLAKVHNAAKETDDYQLLDCSNTLDDVASSNDVCNMHTKDTGWLREMKAQNEGGRERSKEPRERASDEVGLDEDFTFAARTSAGRSTSFPKAVPDANDMITCGEREVSGYSPAKIRKSSSSPREDHSLSPSGLSNCSNANSRRLSPWTAQGVVINKNSFDERQLRSVYKSSSLQGDQRKVLPELSRPGDTVDNLPALPRLRSVSSSSRVLRKAIAGSLLENRFLASELWYPPPYGNPALPKLHMTRHHKMPSTSPSELENSTSSPTSPSLLRRSRSMPNAALGRDCRFRVEQTQNMISTVGKGDAYPSSDDQSSPHSSASGDGNADPSKRGSEAVASLFARAKSKERNKIFVRSRRKPPSADDPRVPLISTGLHMPCLSRPFESDQLSIRRGPSSHSSLSPSEIVNANSACSELEGTFASPTPRSFEVAANEIETEPSKNMTCAHGLSFSRDATVRCEQNENQARSQLEGTFIDQYINKTLELSTSRRHQRLVPGGDELARVRTIRSTPERLTNGDDDAKETSIDNKLGFDSPVSVFDSPLFEDSPGPLECSEIPPELQGFGLRQLNLGNRNDRARPRLDRSQDSIDMVSREGYGEMTFESSVCQKSSEVISCHCKIPEVAVSFPSAQEAWTDDQEWLESIDIEGFPCPRGNKEDLIYVRNLLVVSEFVESISKVLMRWHSMHQPLHPVLFENLEIYYNQRIYEPRFTIKNGHIKSIGVADARPLHLVLFDAVNEVLLKRLISYLKIWPQVRTTPHLTRPFPLGKVLVWEIWMELCDYFTPSSDYDAATFLLDRDLGKRHEWTGENVEELGLEVENAIFDDLIDDTLRSLTLSTRGHKA